MIFLERIHNKNLVSNARDLRNNMTKEEKHLWYDFLKSYCPRFNRQKIIGKYIVDFYCAKAKLIIELDGPQHFEDKALLYDSKRTEFLAQYGLVILRIPNNEINSNFYGVCEYIDSVVKERI